MRFNASQMDQLGQGGKTVVTPVANVQTPKAIVFRTPFNAPPSVVVSPESTQAGGTLTGWAAINITTTGFDVQVLRSSTTDTTIHWHAMPDSS